MLAPVVIGSMGTDAIMGGSRRTPAAGEIRNAQQAPGTRA
jgi:hypothetical protein